MSDIHNEDLFESTKMSFGDHLEELRVCLVKALLGLAIMTIVGLSIAKYVVRQIEQPLQRALTKFHRERVENELTNLYGTVSDDLLDLMAEKKVVFENVFVEAREFERIAKLAGEYEPTPIQESDEPTNPSETEGESNAEKETPVAPELKIVDTTPPAPEGLMVLTRIWRPLDANVTSLGVHEPFMIWLKAALITGATLASPWIFFQIWSFIAAGLYPHEKHYVYFFLPFSLGLFFAGVALAFFFVFEPVLDFLFTFNRMMDIDPDPRISEWMSFVLLLPLGFGISFQLPLVMLILERVGIVTLESYLEKWRVAVLVIFVISMLLTPADPISMLLMACPLTLLYFGGIALCKYLPKSQSPYGEGYDPS